MSERLILTEVSHYRLWRASENFFGYYLAIEVHEMLDATWDDAKGRPTTHLAFPVEFDSTPTKNNELFIRETSKSEALKVLLSKIETMSKDDILPGGKDFDSGTKN